MFVKVSNLPFGQACEISGYGRTALGDDPRLSLLSQEEFIRDMMSLDGRRKLLGCEPPHPAADIASIAERWVSQIGIHHRVFFTGTTAELGAIAAKKCLEDSGLRADQLDAIIGGSNTGPGYPSLADHIKLSLGHDSSAMAFDVTEACPTGVISVFNGWNLIRSGLCKNVLVVCAEKATTLAPYDDWRGSNLFGDAAFAFMLSAAAKEAFVFFDIQSLPFEGQIDKIIKTKEGFRQDGNSVHKFVGRRVVQSLIEDVKAADINPKNIKHIVPHQPSKPTLDLLYSKIQKEWPEFNGTFHVAVENIGNTSGASTGQIITEKVESEEIKEGDLVFVTSFGSGLSIANYAFVV